MPVANRHAQVVETRASVGRSRELQDVTIPQDRNKSLELLARQSCRWTIIKHQPSRRAAKHPEQIFDLHHEPRVRRAPSKMPCNLKPLSHTKNRDALTAGEVHHARQVFTLARSEHQNNPSSLHLADVLGDSHNNVPKPLERPTEVGRALFLALVRKRESHTFLYMIGGRWNVLRHPIQFATVRVRGN